jgi:hypothetical protein
LLFKQCSDKRLTGRCVQVVLRREQNDEEVGVDVGWLCLAVDIRALTRVTRRRRGHVSAATDIILVLLLLLLLQCVPGGLSRTLQP